jgi:hypothetical protein
LMPWEQSYTTTHMMDRPNPSISPGDLKAYSANIPSTLFDPSMNISVPIDKFDVTCSAPDGFEIDCHNITITTTGFKYNPGSGPVITDLQSRVISVKITENKPPWTSRVFGMVATLIPTFFSMWVAMLWLFMGRSKKTVDPSIGTLPDATIGALPDATIGALPDATIGALPDADATIGVLPDAAIGTLPFFAILATSSSYVLLEQYWKVVAIIAICIQTLCFAAVLRRYSPGSRFKEIVCLCFAIFKQALVAGFDAGSQFVRPWFDSDDPSYLFSVPRKCRSIRDWYRDIRRSPV